MPAENKDVSELLFLLSSNDTQVRIGAIHELGKTSSLDAYVSLKQLLGQRVPALKLHIKQALSDIENRIREDNAELYEKFFGDGVAAAEKKTATEESADPGGKKIDYDLLAGYIESGDPSARIAAIQACGAFGRDERLEAILAERLGREEHPFVVATLLINLGRCGTAGMRDVIADFLSRPDDRIRANAVEGLEYLGDPSVLPLLIPLAGDSSPRVRANVAKALIGFDPALVKTTLASMAESGDESQAEAARFVTELMKMSLRDAKTPLPEKKPDLAAARAAIASSGVSQEEGLAPARLAVPAIALAIVIAAWAGYRYFSPAEERISESAPTSGQAVSGRQYEVELAQKTQKMVEECEKFISEGKLSDARMSQIKLLRSGTRDSRVKILDGEILLAQKDFRDALEAFKGVVRVEADNPRVLFGLGSCYLNLDNQAEALKFFEQAIQNDRDGKFKARASKAVAEIRSRATAEEAKARSDAEKLFGVMQQVLNDEGPRAVRQYYRDRASYENMEKNWRLLLLDTARWRCYYSPIEVRLVSTPRRERAVEARVLESWHYTNFGGSSWIVFFYNQYTLSDPGKNYAFESDSVVLPLVVSGVADAASSGFTPASDAEKRCSEEIMMACARSASGGGATTELSLWRRIYASDPSNVIAAMELIDRSVVGDTAEASAAVEAALKVPVEKYPFKFAFGNASIRATLLSACAAHYLRLDDRASYVRTLETIRSEMPEFAQALFELAIGHWKNGREDEFKKTCAEIARVEPDYPAYDFFFFPEVYNDNIYAMKSAEVGVGKELMAFFEGVLKKKPDYWRTYYNIGRVMILRENYAGARKFFESALKLSPNNVTVISRMVYCCIRQKDMKKALEYQELAEKLEPEDFQVRRNRKMLAR